MKYNINFVIELDDDTAYEDEELKSSISECLENACITIRRFEVIGIED